MKENNRSNILTKHISVECCVSIYFRLCREHEDNVMRWTTWATLLACISPFLSVDLLDCRRQIKQHQGCGESEMPQSQAVSGVMLLTEGGRCAALWWTVAPLQYNIEFEDWGLTLEAVCISMCIVYFIMPMSVGQCITVIHYTHLRLYNHWKNMRYVYSFNQLCSR